MIKLDNIRALLEDGGIYVVKYADIYIEEDKIVRIDVREDGAEGTDAARRPELKADKVIDGTHKLAIPGLINSHTHAYMTLFRNTADDVPFTTWLFDTVSPMEDAMLPEDAYWGTLLANIEMLRTGTTSYVDMHMSVHQGARAAKESGLRTVLTRGLVGGDRHDEGGLRRISEFREEYDRWNDNNMIGFMMAPHAPYTCGPDFLKYVAELAGELGVGLHIHLGEGDTEMDNLRKDYNMTAIEYADAAGVFEHPCIAAHCVHLSDSDMDILKAKNVSVAANPVSNMKLANGFSDVPGMLKKGIRVCLGTDGAASNNTLNMFREMTFEAMIHKGLKKDPETVSAQDVLRMATASGAAAIGRGDLGSLKEGFKADISILDLQNPTLNPYNNLVSALVYSCNGSEVDTVIVDGRILMEGRQLKTIDEERVYYEVDRISKRISAAVRR